MRDVFNVTICFCAFCIRITIKKRQIVMLERVFNKKSFVLLKTRSNVTICRFLMEILMRNAQTQIVTLKTPLMMCLTFNENPYAKRTKANRNVENAARTFFDL